MYSVYANGFTKDETIPFGKEVMIHIVYPSTVIWS